eukprot:GILI01019495.1.p1 GENE.GILI01019495.1~~GILI01019495.1.p1  ORF type:complete len:348 (-),score=27.39 GILI01019495.1:97-1140(-)
MSAFDEFDAMGEGTFGVTDVENEDFDMFEHHESAARNPLQVDDGGAAIGASLANPQPSLNEAQAVIGSKRQREPIAERPLAVQDFRILHNDPAFKALYSTPDAVTLATPIVVNCIGLVYLGCGVDLRVLACSVRNVEYNCSKAPRAVLRLIEPQCSAIIRSNGVVTIVGSGSIQATKTAAELTARIVRCALGLQDLVAVKFRLRTLMVRFDLQRPVRIADVATCNKECASYEPETFCACIVRLTGTFLSDGSSFESPPVAPPSAPTKRIEEDFDDFGEDNTFIDEDTFQPLAAPQPTQAKTFTATSWSVSASVYVSGKVTMIGSKSFDEVVAAYKKLLGMLKPHMKL